MGRGDIVFPEAKDWWILVREAIEQDGKLRTRFAGGFPSGRLSSLLGRNQITASLGTLGGESLVRWDKDLPSHRFPAQFFA